MTDETRILRTAGIPVVIALILLFLVPKMCVKMVQVSKTRREKEERAVNGLHIESSQKPVSYPAGLDPERVRYLVEIDRTFSAPYSAHIPKVLSIASPPADRRIVAALQKLGFAELGADGTLTLTRDGMLHLDGLVDDGSSWTFPMASREFNDVISIDGDGTTAHAAFAWSWKANPIGAELVTSPKRYAANADLANVGGRWSLTAISNLSGDLE